MSTVFSSTLPTLSPSCLSPTPFYRWSSSDHKPPSRSTSSPSQKMVHPSTHRPSPLSTVSGHCSSIGTDPQPRTHPEPTVLLGLLPCGHPSGTSPGSVYLPVSPPLSTKTHPPEVNLLSYTPSFLYPLFIFLRVHCTERETVGVRDGSTVLGSLVGDECYPWAMSFSSSSRWYVPNSLQYSNVTS